MPAFLGWCVEPKEVLARRYVSDDYLAEVVASNEETSYVLQLAVWKESFKYWRCYEVKLAKAIYPGTLIEAAMADFVKSNRAARQ